jgi:ferredoxin
LKICRKNYEKKERIMIVAERKQFPEIKEMVEKGKKVLVVGCSGCVGVCLTGGDKAVELLAKQLRMSFGFAKEFGELTLTRQCDREFIDKARDEILSFDVVLSMACGAGVQLMAEMLFPREVLPAMNTTFLGANKDVGIWVENCHGCGDCVLDETGGICPRARCSKSMVNGPCGGTTKDGKCEVSKEMDCGWNLIYERLKELARLDFMNTIQPALDWSKDRSSGIRKLVKKELADIEEKKA